ncbi:MAG TPA: aminotransferase class IV [Candidatus Saccharimonadales bacterium]|nr:aminotransferase class IV [Candidatus Saccharimonadales bacterium]
MARIYDKAYMGDGIIPFQEASLSIGSSAVLYGLSVYTVLPVHLTASGERVAFRLDDHYKRLCDSARIIGIDTFEPAWPRERFMTAVSELIAANQPDEAVFVRVTVHVDALVAGTRSRGLHTVLSMFVYEAQPIVPQDGARLKTSVWRRIPDYAIPSRAKVNGAYVNSVLAKQDALDSGYDDCIFLDTDGHVCELSAANIFIVRHNTLITPDATSDLLEGINRRTVLELARDMGIPVAERTIDLTELYIADEVFVSGTSAYLAPVKEIDGRQIATGDPEHILSRLQTKYRQVLRGEDPEYTHLTTRL